MKGFGKMLQSFEIRKPTLVLSLFFNVYVLLFLPNENALVDVWSFHKLYEE